ncbi:hypothetical protein KIW84_075884 [Lathyrus oleraceus]|uniref:Uncharacterized protein n=1 Tax=Pisum sativum TaxID=3888 RepID=A0A9D4VXM0_PEA|nr:hypothetical protein KIW84_075884 [Pisum sativum]
MEIKIQCKLLPCESHPATFRRREKNPVAPPEDVVALNQNNVNGVDLGGYNREVQFILLRRSQSHRAILSSLSSILTSAESIAAVINSESQMDIAVKVDSMVTSFRRRSNASRLSDVDSGDSRAPRLVETELAEQILMDKEVEVSFLRQKYDSKYQYRNLDSLKDISILCNIICKWDSLIPRTSNDANGASEPSP